MTSKLKTTFAVTFTLFLLSVSTLACICVRDKIKAKGFNGRVVYIFNSTLNSKEPITKVTVKLLKRTDDGDKTITEVVTDADGRFAIEKIKSGTYILEAKRENFQTVVTEIKISKSSSKSKDELEIALDLSLECCAGYAKVQKQN
jgi:5-hydroxyisourate hydrolase-like protein (transthyretin family)